VRGDGLDRSGPRSDLFWKIACLGHTVADVMMILGGVEIGMAEVDCCLTLEKHGAAIIEHGEAGGIVYQ
jgi:hypothetical protein